MVEQVQGFTVREEELYTCYKSLTLTEAQLGAQCPGAQPDFQLMMNTGPMPCSLIGCVDAGGVWRGVYIKPVGMFDSLQSREDYVAELDREFPYLNLVRAGAARRHPCCAHLQCHCCMPT